MIPKYYEFTSKFRVLSGFKSLENIPKELKERNSCCPILIVHSRHDEKALQKTILQALNNSEIQIGKVLILSKLTEHNSIEHLAVEFIENSCDGIIALGDRQAFKLARELYEALPRYKNDNILLMGTQYNKGADKIPLVMVPASESGLDIIGEPDLIVIDPRMSYGLSQRETVAFAMDIICHAIETYTSIMKNPISDALVFSALNLVREHLPAALKYGRDKLARTALANAALLSSMAFMNSQAGIAHALAYSLEHCCKVSHQEAITIILPHCMDGNLLSFDQYYCELLYPLAGPVVFSDTPCYERGRKTIQVLRNMLTDYNNKYGLPVSLSDIGVKRADIPEISEFCLKFNSRLKYPQEISKDDIENILNMAF